MDDVAQIVRLVWAILGPIATAMVEACARGEDPLEVLAKERVEQIIPATLKSELALLAAKRASEADDTRKTKAGPR